MGAGAVVGPARWGGSFQSGPRVPGALSVAGGSFGGWWQTLLAGLPGHVSGVQGWVSRLSVPPRCPVRKASGWTVDVRGAQSRRDPGPPWWARGLGVRAWRLTCPFLLCRPCDPSFPGSPHWALEPLLILEHPMGCGDPGAVTCPIGGSSSCTPGCPGSAPAPAPTPGGAAALAVGRGGGQWTGMASTLTRLSLCRGSRPRRLQDQDGHL